MGTNKVNCPECNAELPLTVDPNNDARLQASCNCNGGRMRVVYSTDNVNKFNTEWLEPMEKAPIQTNVIKRSKIK